MPGVRPLRSGDPETIGGYRLSGVLGSGGQGVVYKAADDTGREVAIKLLHSHLAQDDAITRGFLREVESARRVAAFCTAAVLDVGMADDRPYIVSEYVAGDTLQALVRASGPRTGGALDRLAISTLTALAAIHEAGIVHRDFKPGNVLMGPEGPIVIDFGIAKALGATTQASGPVGTPTYMSPEQFKGERIGPASDVFSWAGTMVFAATGRPPFSGETVPAILHQVMSGTPDLTGVPPHLAGPIEACLAKDPTTRPAPATLLRHLISAPTSHPGSGSSPSQPGFAASPSDPGFGASPSRPGFGASPSQPGFGSSPSSPPGRGPMPAHPSDALSYSQPSTAPRHAPDHSPPTTAPGGRPENAVPPGNAPPKNSAPPGGPVRLDNTIPPGGSVPPGNAMPPGNTVPPGKPIPPGHSMPPGNAVPSALPGAGPQAGGHGVTGPGVHGGSQAGGHGATGPAVRDGSQAGGQGVTGPAVHGEPTRPGVGGRVSRRAVVIGGAAAAVAAAASAFAVLRPASGLVGADDGTSTPTTPATGTSPGPSTDPSRSPSEDPSPPPSQPPVVAPFGTKAREPVTLPAGSGDPACLAAEGPVVVCGTTKGTVVTWDLSTTSTTVTRLGDGGGATTAVAYGGGRAASGHRDGRTRLWNASGKSLGSFRADDPVIAVTTAGPGVAVTQKYDSLTDLHSVVRLWDISKGRQIGPAVTDHFQGVNGLAFGKLGSDDVLVTGDGANRIRVRRLSDGKVTHTFKTGEIGGIELLACGEVNGRSVLVSTHLDATLRVYDLATGKRRKQWKFSKRSPDDRGATSLVVGSREGTPVAVVAHAPSGGEATVRVWNLTNGKIIGNLGPGPGAEIRTLALAELAGNPVVIGTGDDDLLNAWSLGPT